MPYCPDCLIEYVEGTTKCEDCGADLLAGSPPAVPPRAEMPDSKDSRLIAVHVFSGGTALLDADVARSILETNGIPCVLPGETSAELLPVLDIPLLVREEDAQAAARILREYFQSSATAPPE
jgi:hypothetical protein